MVRFKDDVLKEKPDYVYLMFGTNDATMIELSKPKVSKSDYKRNLQYFIDELCKINAKPILMTCIPLIEGNGLDGYYYSRHEKRNFTGTVTAKEWYNEYNDIIRSLSQQNYVPCIDLWKHFIEFSQGSDDKSLLQSGLIDSSGTHLTKEGAGYIYNVVAESTMNILLNQGYLGRF